jgi:hypothetical protein
MKEDKKIQKTIAHDNIKYGGKNKVSAAPEEIIIVYTMIPFMSTSPSFFMMVSIWHTQALEGNKSSPVSTSAQDSDSQSLPGKQFPALLPRLPLPASSPGPEPQQRSQPMIYRAARGKGGRKKTLKRNVA